MNSPLKYFPPIATPTGHLIDQPTAEQTRSDWYFDRGYNYQSTGFIDAPSTIPCGGTRALDSGPLRLAVSHVWREARQ